MAIRTGEKSDQKVDYQWLLREATGAEFWFAIDSAVDWIEKRKQIRKLRPVNEESTKKTDVK
ncbi:MAG: hypothetical protein ACK2T4_11770 [Candidatus Promineifilaceae bacterium]|jgi:hypothetical protein